jgi:hypothetical protein
LNANKHQTWLGIFQPLAETDVPGIFIKIFRLAVLFGGAPVAARKRCGWLP